MVYFEDGLVEQDILEAFALQSYQRIVDLEKYGATYNRDSNGRLTGTPQRGLKHVIHYTQKPFGAGGKKMVHGLVNEAKRLGVKLMSKIFITNLLTADGKAIGAVGFNIRTGEFHIFKANAVVLAAGSGNIESHYQDMGMSTGDGTRMAFEVGCELRNMEFVTFWVVPKIFGYAGITNLLPMGARFINAHGEEFVDKYSPILKSNCDFNYLSMFMALEARAGKGPFYLDCSQMHPKDKTLMIPGGGWTQLQHGKMQDIGINIFEDKTEWMPGFHGSMGGSVKTEKNMVTAVPGLYVAGRLRSMDPGLYLGGWALGTCAAFGCWAGENAAKYAVTTKIPAPDINNITSIKNAIYNILGVNGVEPADIIKEIQEAFFPYNVILIKSEANLKKALRKIEDIRDNMLPHMGARDLHLLRKSIEVKSMILMAELVLRASIMRTESRASHFREDYPARDDTNWLKWILIRKQDKGLSFSTETVPFQKYKFKPERFYSDNFRLMKNS